MTGHGPWQDAAALADLRRRGAMVVKLGQRQIALFATAGGGLHACNNRCPHEGYPLAEGHLDEHGVLTCQWHNWKFKLCSGANLLGGDALRIYPVRETDGRVEIDLSEPAPEQVQAGALTQFDAAMADEDRPRIARELARLEAAGGRVETALARAVATSHEHLRYGMTHAYAAVDAWLSLRDGLSDPAQKLAAATEAAAHIAHDALREPIWPYTDVEQPWHAAHFLAAVQAQDEAGALALLQGALAQGLGLEQLEPVLARAALAHYNDFGHALIYLGHLPGLVKRLGTDSLRPLLRAWLRALVMATREDLLPDFKAYAPALARWPVQPRAAGQHEAADPARFEALTVRQTLDATLAAAAHMAPEAVLNGLLHAAAHHLLRFDERWATRDDSKVADQVGWLDFSHAITFAQALRRLGRRHAELWPAGLLQLALFVGRNTPYLAAEMSPTAAMAGWQVADLEAFDNAARLGLVDHGLGLDIFSVHRVKTFLAVQQALADGVPPALAGALHAALNRLLAARFKQRHALRGARQALDMVSREA